MARRQTPARKIPRPKPGQWPAFFRSLDKQQRHAAAEGQSRPAPSGKPPMTYAEHFDAQAQQIKDREEAAQADTDEGAQQ